MKKYLTSSILLLAIILIYFIAFKPHILTYNGYRYFSKIEATAVYSKNGKFLGVKKECTFALISRCNLKNVVALEKVNSTN